MAKKNNRNRKSGWARTKWFPHGRHPARYRKTSKGNDEVEYLTFTHSDEVVFPDGSVVQTVPMYDNVSKKEREENKRNNLKQGKNRSYAYPKVYKGKRSALGQELNEFSFADDKDKQRADKMFEVFPVEHVPDTGGKVKYKKWQKK